MDKTTTNGMGRTEKLAALENEIGGISMAHGGAQLLLAMHHRYNQALREYAGLQIPEPAWLTAERCRDERGF